jgi:hypothetical protein
MGVKGWFIVNLFKKCFGETIKFYSIDIKKMV